MSYETILVTTDQGVLTVTLNRPESLNSFNDQMIRETTKAFKGAARNQEIRAVIITGEGRAFSSGQDLKDVTDRGQDFSLRQHVEKGYNQLILSMVNLEKPVIAAVNGVAAGAGCSVALAADIRIASDKASFIQVFSRVGLIPDSGSTWILPRLIGYSRAYEMAITSDRISADRALLWGLINEVAPANQLLEITNGWARTLATGPTLAYGLTKRAMNKGLSMSLSESLKYEGQLQELASRSDDYQEGVQSFLEKREAQFKGR